MHALNRKQRRTILSFTRRQKWGQLASLIGTPKALEVAAKVRALPTSVRKDIGRNRYGDAITSYFDSKRRAQ